MKHDDMTWKAAISSEIFREYVSNELKREALEKSSEAKFDKIELEAKESENAFEEFDNFEREVLASPFLKNKFKKVKEYLIKNPDVISKVDSNFVNGVMMLNFED